MNSPQIPDVIEIDDAREAVGDWPEIDTPCDRSPAGQCVYVYPDYRLCIYCDKPSGLDR